MNTKALTSTHFRHTIQTSEEIMDIINYLENKLPGTRIKASQAIRFAIANQAIAIRGENDKDKND